MDNEPIRIERRLITLQENKNNIEQRLNAGEGSTNDVIAYINAAQLYYTQRRMHMHMFQDQRPFETIMMEADEAIRLANAAYTDKEAQTLLAGDEISRKKLTQTSGIDPVRFCELTTHYYSQLSNQAMSQLKTENNTFRIKQEIETYAREYIKIGENWRVFAKRLRTEEPSDEKQSYTRKTYDPYENY